MTAALQISCKQSLIWWKNRFLDLNPSIYPGDSSTVPVPCARQLPSESWGSQQQLVGHNICLSHKPAAGFFVCVLLVLRRRLSTSPVPVSEVFCTFCNEPWSSFSENENKHVDLLRCGSCSFNYLSRSFGEPGSSRIWPGSIFQQPGRSQHLWIMGILVTPN